MNMTSLDESQSDDECSQLDLSSSSHMIEKKVINRSRWTKDEVSCAKNFESICITSFVLLSLCFEVDYYFPVAGKSVYV